MDVPTSKQANEKWILAVQEWRKLSTEQQRVIRLRNLPHKLARSMAFEGEPVDQAMLERKLARLTQPPTTAKPHSAS